MAAVLSPQQCFSRLVELASGGLSPGRSPTAIFEHSLAGLQDRNDIMRNRQESLTSGGDKAGSEYWNTGRRLLENAKVK